MMGDVRRLKEPHCQPVILSKENAFAMVDVAPNLKVGKIQLGKGQRSIYLTLKERYSDKKKAAIALFYSAGLRLSECVNLRMSCIDRKRMVINIQQSKGAKDRIAILSPKTIDIPIKHMRVCLSILLNNATGRSALF
jgi:site-specific recombinase XerD